MSFLDLILKQQKYAKAEEKRWKAETRAEGTWSENF